MALNDMDTNLTSPARRDPARRALPLKRAALILVAAALIAEQAVFFLGGSGAHKGHGAAPAHATHATTFSGRVASIISAALGPGDRGVRRFRLTAISTDPRVHGQRIVNLTWAINGDLSLGSVSAGAQADVYLMLRGLYTSNLPISMARLTGTFGQRGAHGGDVEVPVLVVGMSRATARLIDWQNMDADMVWPLVHRYMERPGFECQCQD